MSGRTRFRPSVPSAQPPPAGLTAAVLVLAHVIQAMRRWIDEMALHIEDELVALRNGIRRASSTALRRPARTARRRGLPLRGGMTASNVDARRSW